MVANIGDTGHEMHSSGRYDLHTHTRASDGMNTPAEQIRRAKVKGLQGVAITDHDTVSGIKEALEAGTEHGVTVIPGVEISTRAKGKDIHVLGYFVNYLDPLLLQRLQELRETRGQRNLRILEKLRELGVELTMDEVIAQLGRPLEPDESIGRPHIADALVHKGYASDMRDAFDRYLAEGAAASVSVPRVSPGQACDWIRAAGGVPVLAHPGLYADDALVEAILEEHRPVGIEVYHADHDTAAEERYARMAEQYGLIPTAGSDYHGERQGVVFHGDLGSRTVATDIIEQLRQHKRSGSE
ncbi:PHP domain-containing protein [Paenibacillus massiliensis]|uniref:PHP domain-containing protein n=1 Tax=Paenibacillus massiliensis TaxID=225917 RepID=UPI00041ABEDB|nr:PHP domain-containing protein [Paenibacillus massiliensis]